MSDTIKSHKDLIVWKRSMTLVKMIYQVTNEFPKEEIYSLSNQMRRSAVSVPSNIAEGAGRNSSKEFKRFCNISMGSLSELETQVIIANELEYIKDVHLIIQLIIDVRRLLSGLKNSLQGR